MKKMLMLMVIVLLFMSCAKKEDSGTIQSEPKSKVEDSYAIIFDDDLNTASMELLDIESTSAGDTYMHMRDMDNQIIIFIIRGYPNSTQRFRSIIETGVYVNDTNLETYLRRMR